MCFAKRTTISRVILIVGLAVVCVCVCVCLGRARVVIIFRIQFSVAPAEYNNNKNNINNIRNYNGPTSPTPVVRHASFSLGGV